MLVPSGWTPGRWTRSLCLPPQTPARWPGGHVWPLGGLSPQRRAARAGTVHRHRATCTVRGVPGGLSPGTPARGFPSAWQGRAPCAGRWGQVPGAGAALSRRCSRCGRLGDSESLCVLTHPPPGAGTKGAHHGRPEAGSTLPSPDSAGLWGRPDSLPHGLRGSRCPPRSTPGLQG